MFNFAIVMLFFWRSDVKQFLSQKYNIKKMAKIVILSKNF